MEAKVIKNVSKTRYKLVRYSGACKVNGKEYIYNPKTDELILETYFKEYLKNKC